MLTTLILVFKGEIIYKLASEFLVMGEALFT